MSFFETLGNNIRHDIRGNFLQSRELGLVPSLSYLAKKTFILARAAFKNKTIVINDHRFFDTWNLSLPVVSAC